MSNTLTPHLSGASHRLIAALSPPTLHEKLDLLWGSDTTPIPLETDSRPQSLLAEPSGLSALDGEKEYAYLVEHAAFGWLVNRITVAMTTSDDTKTIDATRAALFERISNNERFSLRVDWALRDFFESQFEDTEHVELASVICICGTISRPQALSAGEYVDMIWPELGLQVLKGISTALQNVSGKQQGTSQEHDCGIHLQCRVTNFIDGMSNFSSQYPCPMVTDSRSP